MLFVAVTQMYSKKVVYFSKAKLVTQIFCYQYSTINNFVKNNIFQTKFGSRFSYLFEIKLAKFYSDFFRFNIFVVRCLRGYFFPDTVYRYRHR